MPSREDPTAPAYRLVRAETIARPHPEFLGWVLTPAPFAALDRAGVTSATGGR